MSTRREDELFADDILGAVARIESYLTGVEEDAFFDSHLLQDAVIRQLEVIGEAARRLSPAFRDARPVIPWRDVIGMSAKLSHDYLTVDLRAVWDTATRDIYHLREQLTR